MVNYIAAIPAKAKGLGGKEKFYTVFTTNILSACCSTNAKYKEIPKAMALYSWIVPCYTQSCPSKDTMHRLYLSYDKTLENYVKHTN